MTDPRRLAVPLLLALCAAACAPSSARALTEVTLAGGNITLAFAVPVPGSDPSDVSDFTTCDLNWDNDAGTKKLTVATDVVSPVASLVVQAANVSNGTAAGSVTLSTTAQDFVTAVSTGPGSCDLQYTASTGSAAASGSEIHTITYTIVSG